MLYYVYTVPSDSCLDNIMKFRLLQHDFDRFLYIHLLTVRISNGSCRTWAPRHRWTSRGGQISCPYGMVRPTSSTLTVWQHQTSNFSPTPLGHLATEHTSRATVSITYGNPTNRTSPSSGRSSLLSLRPPSHGDNSGWASTSDSSVTTSRSSRHGSTSLPGTPPCLTYSATSFCMLPNTTVP